MLIKSRFQNNDSSERTAFSCTPEPAVGLVVSYLPSGFEKDLPTSLHPTGVPAGRFGGKSLS
ncbi:hypothetical protein C6Y45_12230 [Alkalicoccus saliphilus]|uniref:Uncharacterized protein n=1 Tax=Alkalicoccus saliphilus TaxID=200989 RepID=A0A2T4U4F7_9BACI|nr:hypothetical protein C6Y45_12230 [Alkalicoccus saliphilus]